MIVLGLDLGGTKLASALFDEQGKILDRDLKYLEKRSGKQVALLIKKQIDQHLNKAIRHNKTVKAIGISVPGIYNSKTGCVWAPNIPDWDQYPLLKEISSIPELRNMKVSIDSDRACYILGETWQGAAKGCSNAIFIAVGTGIGAGILSDGRIVRGHSDVAGAVGWMTLDSAFKKEYASCGFFEYHASGLGLEQAARDNIDKKSIKSSMTHLPFDKINTKIIFEAFQSGDPVAHEIINRAILYWGMAVANLVSIFNPEKIIFGGGIFGPAAQFIPQIIKEAEKWAQPISMQQVKIELSLLGADAGLFGAAKLAFQAIQH
jgi:glucokinase